MIPRVWAPLRWATPGLAVALFGAGLGAARTSRSAHAAQRATDAFAFTTSLAAFAVQAPEPSPPPAPTPCTDEPPPSARSIDVPPLAELARLVRQEPRQLGSASIGSPTHGALWGGVELVANEGLQPFGTHTWGTELAVRSIERAVRVVRRCFVDTPKLFVGDISRKEGGGLRPHRSHQSGLDADIGYYYVGNAVWFQQATAANLDRARTWALVRALIDGGNVDSIFMASPIQHLLRQHAESIGEDPRQLDDIFESDKRRHDVVIHHAPGHTGHFHVRFRDPSSVALGAGLLPIFRAHP